MLRKILQDPEFGGKPIVYAPGSPILLEGDDSKDLYLLVEGSVAIIKGTIRIATVSDPGHLFGEISYLLGSRRTATVKAVDQVKVVRIPGDRVTEFLDRFPEVSRDIARFLAERLEQTSHAMFGLKQIAEQLPEAVVVTDREGRVLSFNRAAAAAFGRGWDEMNGQHLDQLIVASDELEEARAKALAGHSATHVTLEIEHPTLGRRFLATSCTVLSDARHRFQGVLLLSHDVTSSHRLVTRMSRVKRWLLPALLALALLVAGLSFGWLDWGRRAQPAAPKALELAGIMSRDFLLLKSLLAKPLAQRDCGAMAKLVKPFFVARGKDIQPYTGLVVLDRDRRVVFAYSRAQGAKALKTAGVTYAHLPFQGEHGSAHKMVSLYRQGPDNSSNRGVEMAFPLSSARPPAGWLVFQMDLANLKKRYELKEEDLAGLPTTAQENAEPSTE